jgi:hypothetical protein
LSQCVAVGYEAGFNLTTGSNNIDIGNAGVADESDVIRIGTNGIQKEAFVAGIYNHPLTGNVVVVNSAGRLGVPAVSSERFKTAIAVPVKSSGCNQPKPGGQLIEIPVA